jgi:hypothetical protein
VSTATSVSAYGRGRLERDAAGTVSDFWRASDWHRFRFIIASEDSGLSFPKTHLTFGEPLPLRGQPLVVMMHPPAQPG